MIIPSAPFCEWFRPYYRNICLVTMSIGARLYWLMFYWTEDRILFSNELFQLNSAFTRALHSFVFFKVHQDRWICELIKIYLNYFIQSANIMFSWKRMFPCFPLSKYYIIILLVQWCKRNTRNQKYTEKLFISFPINPLITACIVLRK